MVPLYWLLGFFVLLVFVMVLGACGVFQGDPEGQDAKRLQDALFKRDDGDAR